MGLLSRLMGITSNKKPTDDVLLVNAMLLMAGADGHIDQEEIATVSAFAATLPEFKSVDFGNSVVEAQKVMRRYGSLQESIQALAELSTPALKVKAFVIAADIALSSGDVDENEDALLEAMQRVLDVDDATAQQVITVLSLKYTS